MKVVVMDYRLILLGIQIQVICTHVPSQVTLYSAQILIICGDPYVVSLSLYVIICATSVCDF